MKYKVVKLSKRIKKRPYKLETYQPKKRIKVCRENTVPLIIRAGNRFAMLGGLISVFASSLLIGLKGVFHIEKKVKSFNSRGKVVELKLKE
jgi:hypothetical protein